MSDASSSMHTAHRTLVTVPLPTPRHEKCKTPIRLPSCIGEACAVGRTRNKDDGRTAAWRKLELGQAPLGDVVRVELEYYVV